MTGGVSGREAHGLTRRAVERVVAKEEIRNQARDNTEDQFVGGDTVENANTLAMWEFVQNQVGMSEFFSRDGDEQRSMRVDFARAVWHAVHAEYTAEQEEGAADGVDVLATKGRVW